MLIDAEIFVTMETMSALKIHFLDKEEITLRTDCQVIISFHNKSIRNKPSRVRWIDFTDFITGTGVKVNFEYIDGKLNVFADNLSRLMEDSKTLTVLTKEEIGGSAQFPLLTEYEDLIHEAAKNILLPEEHHKRRRMRDIEDQAIKNASLAINELELIQQMKETPDDALCYEAGPKCNTPGAKALGVAGYDLSLIHTYIIETGERELISTGLAIAIPKGYYGRITPRSGVAWQKGIQIGAGVIDNDFRGGVKILVFNMTYGNIVLNKGEAIAQLILEKIATPEVIQMVELPQTVRGAGSFGSTTEQNMNQRTMVTNPIDASQVQIGTLEWENLMNKLVPLNSTPSTSQQQLHVLTTDEPDEWINPFYTEGGGYESSNSSFNSAESDDNAQMIAHIDLEEGLELDYPIQKQSEDYYWGIEVVIAPPPPMPYEEKNLVSELLSYIDYLLVENRRLTAEINRLTKRYSD
ncbi:hypothetical protein ZIOFF_009141 [Zingiber officinale]|uniref:dUTP diphosphatase n=1 Tax=Zingiber officinale TaxID=94328 RepID=A0A8J5HH96_ZINOF|nr:hypothetical protein ZIOFF_009141 [Zingiber officinale]